MKRVLIIDDDPGIQETFGFALRLGGFDTAVATLGRDGIDLALRLQPDVVLIDLRLPDISGLDVLRQIAGAPSHPHSIVMTGFGSTRTAIEAMRLGAIDYLEKPVDLDDLLSAVTTAAGDARATQSPSLDHVAYASARWAAIVVALVESPRDPNTVRAWGRSVGASASAIKSSCRMAGLPVRQSLHFARLLRAILRRGEGERPSDLLDIVDLRTLRKLLGLGQEPPPHGTMELPATVEEFLERQLWIQDQRSLEELRKALILKSHVKLKR
jgi:ActR/RegA family two-component response regulator